MFNNPQDNPCYDCHQNNLSNSNIQSYDFSNHKDNSYEIINSQNYNENINDYNNYNINNNNVNENETINKEIEECETSEDYYKKNNKEIWKKLKKLENNLHLNNISDKKSACFWCTYDFDNPPIYIPKFFIKDSYNVYGCFCSPECATAHLMNENIDSSTKFERYFLLNNIYSKIYDYKKNIKPSPDRYYMLDKFKYSRI